MTSVISGLSSGDLSGIWKYQGQSVAKYCTGLQLPSLSADTSKTAAAGTKDTKLIFTPTNLKLVSRLSYKH